MAVHLGNGESGEVRDQDPVLRAHVPDDVLTEIALDLRRERVSGAEVAQEIAARGERTETAASPRPP